MVAVLLVGLWWFEPWKLFVDERVDEAFPGPGAAASPTPGGTEAPSGGTPTPSPGLSASPSPEATTSPSPAGPVVLSDGTFRSLEHETTGRARLIGLPDGSFIVRLEDLATSNGPDLIVILSDTPATEDGWGAYDDGEFASLGELKGNIGNQNYTVPPGVDPSRYRSVVVWCRRFTVGFGAAPLDVTR